MKTLVRMGFMLCLLFSSLPAWGQNLQAQQQPQPKPTRIESRMALILEFDTMSAQFLDRLFANQVPDKAMLEWCEKTEVRAMGRPAIQQAFGYFYIAIKATIKGEAKRARIMFQQALWLMARERYAVIQAAEGKDGTSKQ